MNNKKNQGVKNFTFFNNAESSCEATHQILFATDKPNILMPMIVCVHLFSCLGKNPPISFMGKILYHISFILDIKNTKIDSNQSLWETHLGHYLNIYLNFVKQLGPFFVISDNS